MRNPEFSSSFDDLNDNPESLRSVDRKRGDEVNRAKMRIEEEERQKELLRRQAELEEKLRSLGVDPQEIIDKARADFKAKNLQKAVAAKKTAEKPAASEAPTAVETPKTGPALAPKDSAPTPKDSASAPKEAVPAPKETTPAPRLIIQEDISTQEADTASDDNAEEPEVDTVETSEASPAEVSEQVGTKEISPANLGKKLWISSGFKKLITSTAVRAGAIIGAIVIAGGMAFGTYNSTRNNKKLPADNQPATEMSIGNAPGTSIDETIDLGENTPSDSVESPEEDGSATEQQSNLSGETAEGTGYNYTEYADRDNKVSYNAYGYNKESAFNDREATAAGILEMAKNEPEALASYSYNIFTSDEKKELGIDGLNMTEIDNRFDQEGGGELQKKLLDKLQQILEDEGSTRFDFYYENDTEKTNYIYFIDDNGDGKLTPDELHLGYDVKKRDNAPQVDVYRSITMSDGTVKEVKMLDLNMRCGYQPNYGVAPEGVKYVKAEEKTDIVIPPVVIDTPTPEPETPETPEEPEEPETPEEPEEPEIPFIPFIPDFPPEPTPTPEPEPTPTPEPEPTPTPEPEPTPTPEPEPTPTPEPEPTPTPEPEPTPTPEPEPTPTPEPEPTPTPEPEPTPTPTPEPEPEPEWGKSGDPHGGDLVTPSNPVNPESEVTKEYIETVNEGNQGYVDDNKATPGSSSEQNGVNEETGFAASGIVAEGATTEGGRLTGGEDQSDGNLAGENAYQDQEAIAEGQAEDEAGNAAQAEAQVENEVGGDNNSDEAEEARVAEGNF